MSTPDYAMPGFVAFGFSRYCRRDAAAAAPLFIFFFCRYAADNITPMT
jgi:hypothetical protein